MMEVVSTSETSFNFCEITWRSIPEERFILAVRSRYLMELRFFTLVHDEIESSLNSGNILYLRLSCPLQNQKVKIPYTKLQCYLLFYVDKELGLTG
jgi:hypothetical protein